MATSRKKDERPGGEMEQADASLAKDKQPKSREFEGQGTGGKATPSTQYADEQPPNYQLNENPDAAMPEGLTDPPNINRSEFPSDSSDAVALTSPREDINLSDRDNRLVGEASPRDAMALRREEMTRELAQAAGSEGQMKRSMHARAIDHSTAHQIGETSEHVPVVLHEQTVLTDVVDDENNKLYRVSGTVDGERRVAYVRPDLYDKTPVGGDARYQLVRALLTSPDFAGTGPYATRSQENNPDLETEEPEKDTSLETEIEERPQMTGRE